MRAVAAGITFTGMVEVDVVMAASRSGNGDALSLPGSSGRAQVALQRGGHRQRRRTAARVGDDVNEFGEDLRRQSQLVAGLAESATSATPRAGYAPLAQWPRSRRSCPQTPKRGVHSPPVKPLG